MTICPTLDQMSREVEVGSKLRKNQMSIPLPVEGVGKKSQVADQSLTTVTKRWMHLTVHH